jgi:hypothetical protein
MKNKVNIFPVLFLSIGVLSMAGCASSPGSAAAVPTETMHCIYPLIAALPQTTELQSKSGISISLASSTYQCTPAVNQTRQEVNMSFSEGLALGLQTNGHAELYKIVETTSRPVFKVVPDRIAFRIKINNEMPRVFRGAGTVVLYNFGGKNTSVSARDYSELSNIIVPPRTEAEVTIFGPPFEAVPDKTTLGIFLYDVVTKTDDAGNILKKENFEWYYNYQTQTKEDVGQVTTVREAVAR